MMPRETPPQPAISVFLGERITAGDFPSAVYAIAQQGKVLFADALGHSVADPYRIAASVETIYDLASLTKPLVTGLLCSRRIESGEVTLDSSVAHYLAEFDRPDKNKITIRHLLTHTSGLPAWRPLYILAEGVPDRAASTIATEPLEYEPGTRVIYSDLGFITLGLLLERMTGSEIVTLAQQEIIEPLRMRATFFNPAISLQTGIAACETGNAYERQTSEAMGKIGYGKWRENLIWGEVHDANAHFLGGAAGHAGLFSNVTETMRLAQQFLGKSSRLLDAKTCALFSTNMTAGLNEARSIAWQLAATPESAAGPTLPPDSFGHSGFTGTSCWIDPHHDRVFVLLTNRTHARLLPFANLNSVRRRFHTLAVAAIDLGS
ncbi:MAG: serine hydrolase [Acidobacteriota bacterium]